MYDVTRLLVICNLVPHQLEHDYRRQVTGVQSIWITPLVPFSRNDMCVSGLRDVFLKGTIGVWFEFRQRHIIRWKMQKPRSKTIFPTAGLCLLECGLTPLVPIVLKSQATRKRDLHNIPDKWKKSGNKQKRHEKIWNY